MNRDLLAYALIAAALAGCAASPGWLRSDEARQTAELLDYATRVATMNAAEQRRELYVAQSAYRRESTGMARVRLGLLHALPASAIQDDARAIALLESDGDELARGGALSRLAQLVAAQVHERQRQVREEQHKSDALREQLEALKAIERSIIERRDRTGSSRQ